MTSKEFRVRLSLLFPLNGACPREGGERKSGKNQRSLISIFGD
jgi:hypothetical protein